MKLALGIGALIGWLVFTSLEVWGTYEFMLSEHRTVNYIVAIGIAITVATSLMPAMAAAIFRERPWLSVGTMCAFAVALFCVVMTAGLQRAGTATDASQISRERMALRLEQAEQAETEARQDMATKDALALQACQIVNNKSTNEAGCKAATGRQADARARLDLARAAVIAASTVQGDAMAQRVAGMLSFAGATESGVRNYQPVVIPALAAVFASLFMAIGAHLVGEYVTEWRQSRAKAPEIKAEPPSTTKGFPRPIVAEVKPAAIVPVRPRPLERPPLDIMDGVAAAPVQQPLYADLPSSPKLGSTSMYWRERMRTADGEEVNLKDVWTDYLAWNVARKTEPLSMGKFLDSFAQHAGKSGVEIAKNDDKFFAVGCRLN